MTTTTIHDPTVQIVTADLTALGNTHDAVADALLKGGHRGNPECDTSCPVARHLATSFPGWTAQVIEEDGRLWAYLARRRLGDTYTEYVEAELPAAVAQFVLRFDRGEYAELDERVDPVLAGGVA